MSGRPQLTQRLRNLIRRIVWGRETLFISGQSPRMTLAEVDALRVLGLPVYVDYTRHGRATESAVMLDRHIPGRWWHGPTPEEIAISLGVPNPAPPDARK